MEPEYGGIVKHEILERACIHAGEGCENICGHWKKGFIKMRGDDRGKFNHGQMSNFIYFNPEDLVNDCEYYKETGKKIDLDGHKRFFFVFSEEEEKYLGTEMRYIGNGEPETVIISQLIMDGFIAYTKPNFRNGKRSIISYRSNFYESLKTKMKKAREKKNTI